MPLNNEMLRTSLSKFMDPDSDNFVKLAATNVEFADFWKSAIYEYTLPMTPIALNPAVWLAATEASTTALRTALLPSFLPDPTGLVYETIFNLAFLAYGTALAVAIPISSAPPPSAPPTIVVATPPIFPLGTAIKVEVFPIGISGGSYSDIVNKHVEVINRWFKAGTFTNTGTTAVINWS